MARRDIKRYRKNGPDATTRELIEVLSERVPADATLIDVGSGIGALSHALLQGPVSRVTMVDESSSYQEVARELATDHGTLERCTFVGDDFVHAQPELGQVDVVALDRVICCYPDYEGLLGAAAKTGASVCGFSHPRDRWYIKPVVAIINLTRWLARSEFRVFVHSESGMRAVLRGSDFQVCSEGGTFVWKVTVMERSSPALASEVPDDSHPEVVVPT